MRVRKTKASTMVLSRFLWEAMLLLAIILSAKAQVPGTDVCSCSPTMFSFTLNFLGTCPGDVMASDSIERTTCVVSDRDFMPISPDIPVNITSIVILEFGLTSNLLSRTTLPGPFDDGESFEFTSIIGTEDFEENDAVQILQIAVNGLNENQVAIRNSLGLVYTNACSVQPIVTVGDTFGWIVFSDFTDPLDELCEASPTTPPVTGPPTRAPDTNLCSCSPRTFTFRFNFNGKCPGNIEPDDAIESITCELNNDFGEQVMDIVPVEVTTITIEEETQSGTLVTEDITTEIFSDGEMFSYTSISETGVTPTVLKITMLGSNSIGVAVFNEIRIQYTNECDEPITFEPDAEIGWLLIEDFSPATPASCQEATPPPTATPTLTPLTPPPTMLPTFAPTTTPSTATPTLAAVTPPPMKPPTVAPTAPPPTAAPTLAPITPPPTVLPTLAPIAPPTLAPKTRPPTAMPTRTPITPPSTAPPTRTTAIPPLTTSPTVSPGTPPHTAPPTPAAAKPPQTSPLTPEPTPDESMSFDLRHIRALVQNEDEIAFGRFQNSGNV